MSDEEQHPPAQDEHNEEQVPKTEDANAPINIKVVSAAGEEIFFKIKRSTKLSKLQAAYASKVGKEVGTIRFLFDGSRINEDDTPASLDMEENDTIDVMVELDTKAYVGIDRQDWNSRAEQDMSDVVELKKLAKALQTGTPEILKKDAVVTESALRQSKAGLAVGKLRSHPSKDVADLAKELVKKWKTDVQKQSGPAKVGSSSSTANPIPSRKASVADSIASPTTPIGSSFNKGQGRSAKTDGVIIKVTGDKTRDKCIELIYDSLSFDSGAPNDLILEQATSIEAVVLSDHNHDTGKDYKGKIRSLYLNLKDKNNPSLRNDIVSGDLAVSKFCRMTSQEMASEERKAADKAIQEENFHKSLGAEEQQAETTAFQCGKCKKWETRYRQAQTRSADEPMTTFVTYVSLVTHQRCIRIYYSPPAA
ncbi:hypothetical protein EW145_g4879 [Phellinidium pouzarii]|uniref:Transcription elongation factor n=1 Tax=Phellinidium pouzarii TaxID=167371 RepID=A0A4S4L1W8_9AGAM|nr:hypothetical protein EW145_g4879 [Phellinidium pouzarii]